MASCVTFHNGIASNCMKVGALDQCAPAGPAATLGAADPLPEDVPRALLACQWLHQRHEGADVDLRAVLHDFVLRRDLSHEHGRRSV